MKTTDEKYERLLTYLKQFDRLAIAFSGGVDSSFLLYAAKQALGESVVALTVKSPYIATWEIDEAIIFCKNHGINHHIIETIIPDEIKNNPTDRCYLCKTKVFNLIKQEALKLGFKFLADGTNADDTSDYRPGLRALSELNVRSPLLECGIKKQEIRQLSQQFGLPTWDKPAYACLLTRIPYDVEIKYDELQRIEAAEFYLMQLGFRAVRVRSHNNLARIEVPLENIPRFFENNLSSQIVQKLKKIGYEHICIDLQGYRMGSYIPEVKKT